MFSLSTFQSFFCPRGPDFVQYWSFFQLLLQGENPYQAGLLWAHELQVEPALGEPLMMWCPPWAPLLMAPLLWLNYCNALMLWILLTCILYALSMGLALRALQVSPKHLCILMGVGALFVPFAENLRVGQIAIFSGLGAALLAYGLSSSRSALQGAGLVLLSVKPHLVLPLVLFLLIDSVQRRSFARWYWALLMLAPLVTLGELLSPGIHLAWINAHLLPQAMAIPTSEWHTSTLAVQLRQQVFLLCGYRLPLWGIPLLSLALVFPTLLRWSPPDWGRQQIIQRLCPLLCFSYLFAPFGWLHDQLILLVPLLAIALLLLEQRSTLHTKCLLASLAAIILLSWGLRLRETSQSEWWWLPLVLSILLALALSLQRRSIANVAVDEKPLCPQS